jgi:hypothetical protein
MADFVNDKKDDDKDEKEEAGEGDDNAPATVLFFILNCFMLMHNFCFVYFVST